MTIALYPGSFDPFTNGHLDVAARAAKLFEKLIIGVYARPNKKILFSVEERVNLVRGVIGNLHNVEVRSFDCLTVDFARSINADTMVRGLRMSTDFEAEFDLAMMNKQLCPELELVCLMASQEYQFLRSSILKEVARLGGNIDNLVPPNVATALKAKVNKNL